VFWSEAEKTNLNLVHCQKPNVLLISLMNKAVIEWKEF